MLSQRYFSVDDFCFSRLVDVVFPEKVNAWVPYASKPRWTPMNSRVTSTNKQTLEIHREVDVLSPETLGHPHRIHGTIVDLPINLPQKIQANV